MKRPWLALMLSMLLTGLGQLYNGEPWKAVGAWVAIGLAILLVPTGIGLVLAPVVWLWAAIDAYHGAHARNRQAVRPRPRSPHPPPRSGVARAQQRRDADPDA
jgi:TM2 domain-containing membrane protein YozV